MPYNERLEHAVPAERRKTRRRCEKGLLRMKSIKELQS